MQPIEVDRASLASGEEIPPRPAIEDTYTSVLRPRKSIRGRSSLGHTSSCIPWARDVPVRPPEARLDMPFANFSFGPGGAHRRAATSEMPHRRARIILGAQPAACALPFEMGCSVPALIWVGGCPSRNFRPCLAISWSHAGPWQ